MEISFNGKRALVTGAGKGIGREIAIQLQKCGAQVVALSRTQSDLDSLKTEFPSIETVQCDISDWDKTKETIESIGNVDLLVNNAAIAICEPLAAIKPQDIDSILNINVKAAINITQTVAVGMIKRGAGGSIVNVSSQASMVALADHIVYSASKAALDACTRTMALELGLKNIRVNAVNPTVITTAMSMVGWSDPEKAKWMTDRIPLGRFGDPIEVANPVLFLLSDKASMITGVTLPVDGGFTAC